MIGESGRGGSAAALVALLLAGALGACGGSSEEASPGAPRQGEPPLDHGLHPIDPPTSEGAMAPNPTAVGDAVLMSWIEPTGGGHRVRFARYEAGRWGEAHTVTEEPRMFVNWADFPSVAASPEGALYAHWGRHTGEGASDYDVILARSDDSGRSWRELGPAHRDGTQSEHGFVSMIPADGDRVRAFWLDGRRTVEGGPMSLRSAVIGAEIRTGAEIDARTCDCCQTAAALTSEGPIVAYRDRSEAELRDISIARLTGTGWSAPARVHEDGWQIAGCPVNGPALDAAGEQVAIAWYSGARGGGVRAAFSPDAGRTFSAPILVDGEGPLGRVDLALLEGGEAAVSWLARSAEQGAAEIRVVRVSAAGRLGEARVVASTQAARASGFPRMAHIGDELLFAWTEAGEPSRVRAARLLLTALPAADRAPPAAPQAARLERGSALPEYRMRRPGGELLALHDLRGHPLVLTFWATWCAPCRAELARLAELQDRHREAGLRILAVSVDGGDPEVVTRFLRERGLPFEPLFDGEEAATTFGVPPVPATFVYDRAGRLVHRQQGAGEEANTELAEVVDRVMQDRISFAPQ